MGRDLLRMLVAAVLAGLLVTLSAACEEEDTCGNYVADEGEDCDPSYLRYGGHCCSAECTWDFDHGDCDDCLFCSTGHMCWEQFMASLGDPDIEALGECLQACSSPIPPECSHACQEEHPEGAAKERALLMCMYCDHCPTSCADRCAEVQSWYPDGA